MTIHAYKNAAVLALALSMLACAAPAYAAGTDYLLDFGGVEGESSGSAARHKGWIELDSVQLGAERSAGGVHVASGDINGDGATDARPHTHKPITIRKEVDKSKPAPAANKKIAAPDDDQTAALLLPAVQKIREAAARTPAWAGCAAGQKIEGMTIKQVSTGRTGRILDPVVATCATESVSFNFTKIEWN